MSDERTLELPENSLDQVEDYTPQATREIYDLLPRPLARLITKAHDRVDPVSFMGSLISAGKGIGRHPADTVRRVTQLNTDMAKAWSSGFQRLLGDRSAAAIAPAKGDRRFKHRAWEDNSYYNLLMQNYLLLQAFSQDMVGIAGLDEDTEKKARFSAGVLTDALSPTNFFATNPEALMRAFETGGSSVVAGSKNMLRDLRKNNGWPKMVDPSKFKLGENMACTPGKVVFRNELIELIQYSPKTEQVHELPLLYNPAWINRFYIMDLSPGKSFVEWAVEHGHTMFAISYRNPDESMRDVSFTDYMMNGPIAAIQVIREITGQEKVNMVSVCLGGTLTSCTLAYLSAIGKDWVNSSTLLNSHMDFSLPGDLGVFADIGTIEALERGMEEKGYADGDTFSRTFNLLRGRELIWNYVSSGWLLGEEPPAFDLLAWNGDSTRLPAKMHSYYLRSCYVDNALAQNKMVLAGQLLKLADIKQDSYVVGAEGDHIVPWHSTYKSTQLLGGKVRYVLSSSGHIAGMVNPPHPKASFYANDKAYPENPDAWLESAQQHSVSWWEDWSKWIGKRAGKKVAAPAQAGSDHHGVIGDAPGRYVRE